jgi:uncharacterized protein YbjT (DUF2867 family)
MKLVVLGSNGGIGKEVVAQGLSAGHIVTAVARRPETVTLKHERLSVVSADVLEPASLPAAFAGQVAVISALGVATREPTRVYSQGISNVIAAMRAACFAYPRAAWTPDRGGSGGSQSRCYGVCLGICMPIWCKWKRRCKRAASIGPSYARPG